MPEPDEQEQRLFKVMVYCTMVSFGVLAAVMISMTGFFGGHVSFQLSYKTPIGFVGGWIAGWLFWRLIKELIRRG